MRWLIFLLIFTGCATEGQQKVSAWMRPSEKIKILCTTGMIADLVEEIGGERVDVLTLIPPGLDPHSYQLVKGDDEKFAFADLIFYSGLGLEHGPSLLKTLQQKQNSFSVAAHIQSVAPDKVLTYEGQPDPHIWMDISLWALTVPYITEVLSIEDPDGQSDFRKNAKVLQEKMATTHKKIQRELREIPSKFRYLVTSHDAFNYFTRAYLSDPEEETDGWQKRFVAPEGLSPESQLSTRDIQETLYHIKEFDIFVVFPESNVSQASLRKVQDAAEKMGLELRIARDPLYGDAMGLPGSGADSYLKMIEKNAETLKKHLMLMEIANGYNHSL